MERGSCIRAMKHVYDVIISGKTIVTTVTNHPDAITEWINVVKADGNRYVGFEVELNYEFGPIGTVQLCVGKRCLVIQLVVPWAWPPSLDEFMSDSYYIIAGVNMEDKLNLLRRQVPCIGVDLTRTAVDLLKDVPSLLKSKQRVLAKYSTVESDWGRLAMLSDAQVHYACVDAFFNLQAAIGISRGTLVNTT